MMVIWNMLGGIVKKKHHGHGNAGFRITKNSKGEQVMAKYANEGIVNVKKAEETILANGGGKNERVNRDGSIHVTCYSRTDNRRFSYDKDSGNIFNVHTSKNDRPYMDYKGGK